MRKMIATLLFTAVMVSFSLPVLANSGPVFWQGYPSSEIMSVEENSPILVENENLLFDFSDWNNSYEMSGKVKAAYSMLNPTSEPRSVQMAFPFVGTLNNLADMVITADGEVLPYRLFFGDVVNSRGTPWQKEKAPNLDFTTILKAVTDETYQPENFSQNEKGKHYILKVQPTTDQRINFAADFKFDPEKTKVLTNGFNRYERNGDKIRIAAWCHEPRTLELFVLGEDIELAFNAFTDGELQQKTDLFTRQISAQEVELKPYLLEYINRNTHLQSGSTVFNNQSYGNQLYNLYAKALDQAFTRNRGYSAEDDLMEQGNYKRIVTLLYTVEFPPNSTKKVQVSYRSSGTMDRSKTVKPLYTFDYLLNPAKNWKDFKNLNITIITPRQAPYVVASNIELARGESNVYTASLADLPEHEFSFTIYSAEKITFLDKVEGDLNRRFGYLAPLVIGALALLLMSLVITVSVKRVNRVRRNNRVKRE